MNDTSQVIRDLPQELQAISLILADLAIEDYERERSKLPESLKERLWDLSEQEGKEESG